MTVLLESEPCPEPLRSDLVGVLRRRSISGRATAAMAPGMPIPSWTRSRNGSSSVALSRNVGSSGDIMLNSSELGMVSPELTDSWKTGGK